MGVRVPIPVAGAVIAGLVRWEAARALNGTGRFREETAMWQSQPHHFVTQSLLKPWLAMNLLDAWTLKREHKP